MSKEFVMVPRELLDKSVNGFEQEQGGARNEIRGLLAKQAVQHQGQPLPITNDMHRLMEACRIGEFKEEGGSETVEALAVASLAAKSTMGHDADSYMSGYIAALYEQAEPFIFMSLKQHQGELFTRAALERKA